MEHVDIGRGIDVKALENRLELKENIATLEKYRGSKSSMEESFYVSLVRHGRCFVCYKEGEEVRFAPSRFIGYKSNRMELHDANKTKDGRITNPAISAVLHSPCEFDEELEKLYCQFCHSLGHPPLHYNRKYWSL